MLTYPNRRTTNIAPVDFDYKALGQASNLLLGKAKTDLLLKDTTPKGILKIIGELEAEAKEVRNDPKRAFPKDISFRRSPAELENLRDQMVREIFGLRNLWARQTLKSSLPYRIRSSNQLEAITENQIEQIGKEGENGTEITARVSLDSLPKTIKDAESSGYAKISFPVSGEYIDYVKNKLKQGNITLTFRDELPERPELKRIMLGNQNSRAQRLAREKKTTPRTEILNIAGTSSGTIVILSNNSRVTNVTEKQTAQGIELEVELMFPEVLSSFEENGPDNGGDGVISDAKLKTHCSNAYGCNGRDFLKSIPEISKALKTNLEEAAKMWFEKEVLDANDIPNFIQEYSILSLCLRHEPTPVGKLEPSRSLVKSTNDLARGMTAENTFELGPETSFSKEILDDVRINMPATASVIAGDDWIDSLVNNEIYQTYKTSRGQNYSQEIENIYGIKNPARKMELIERNYWRTPNQQFLLLDQSPQELEFSSYYLSNEMEEEYELEKEEQEQELFNSKAEYLIDPNKVKKELLDKAEWIKRQNAITLKLPYNGNTLHRLTKYPNRSSGLSIKTTRAEKFDPEVSLATKEYRKIPSKQNGKNIALEDCLTPEGLKNLAKIKQGGSEYQLEEIKRIDSLLEQWQSSLRRISVTSKNPLEHKVIRWLESIALGKEECKAGSLEELSTLLGIAVSQTGRIPYETERGNEHYSMPARSNPLPLKLLCGTGFNELQGLEIIDERTEAKDFGADAVASDPAKLWDTIIRWQNAENIHEMELDHNVPSLLLELENIIKNENVNTVDLINHAIKLELRELPDFKMDYLYQIGLKSGLEGIPKEFKAFSDIFYPLDSSPATTMVKGEETPIEDLLSELASQGVPITLTEDEKRRVQAAPETALEQWRGSIISTIDNLKNIDAPTGKDIELELILSSNQTQEINSLKGEGQEGQKEQEGQESEELDPFMESIALLHQEIPQSEEDLKDILKNLITHNPQRVTVTTPEGTIELHKGSGNEWVTKNKNEQSKTAVELFNKAQKIVSENIDGSPENNDAKQTDPDFLTYLDAKSEARKTRLFENIEQLPKVLDSIPKELANHPRIKELCQPLSILATQVHDAKKASELGESLIKGWMGAPEEKENPWGWDQAVLNPVGSVEYLCDKITGKKEKNEINKDREKEPSELQEAAKVENKASYFTHTLIKDSEKLEAIERLRNNGSVVAGNYLIETLNGNLLAIKAQATNTLPELIGDLETQLKELVSQSHSKEVKDFICGQTPIKTLLEDKAKYRILESKIREAAKEIGQTKGAVRTVFQSPSPEGTEETEGTEGSEKKGRTKHSTSSWEEVEYEQLGRDILTGAGYKVPTVFEVSPTGTEIKTNKLWATKWLNSELGKKRLEERINFNTWVNEACKKASCGPKTAIAFIEFCKHRNLLNVAEAVSSNKLKEEEKKAILEALRNFKESLNSLCIDPQKAKFSTQLIAGYALSQYVEGNKEGKLWNKTAEKDLERISHSVETNDMTINAKFAKELDNDQNNNTNRTSVPSPFKKKRELVSGLDLEADIEHADPKTKLRTVVKAVSVLYKAIPTEKSGGKKQKTQTKVKNIKPKKGKESTELAVQV